MMRLRSSSIKTLLTLVATTLSIILLAQTTGLAQSNSIQSLEGEWVYVEDRTKNRPVENQGPPFSAKFKFRVEEDAVFLLRGTRPEQRLPIDGSVTETTTQTSVTRYRSEWTDGTLTLETEILRKPANNRIALIRIEFSPIADGLLVRVPINGVEQLALYQHPEAIEKSKPVKAAAGELAWLTGAWVSEGGGSTTEERWSPAKGGALLGVSRTVKNSKMVAFEFLRIVERDGGLIYVAQPGGKPPTEFTLVEMKDRRAVFENPSHDFPQRIVYSITSEGRLTASIGLINGGKPHQIEFTAESKMPNRDQDSSK